MRKLILLFISLFVFEANIAQEQDQWRMRTRVLNVNESNVEAFEKAVANKTDMYNSKEGQPRWITFRILSGPQSNQYLRMQMTTDINDFDNEDTEGNQYWEETVGPLHTSTGNLYWSRSNWMSYTPKNTERVNLRRIIYYSYQDEYEQDFWRFRRRVKLAMEESGYPSRMSVLNCNSGCAGNIVQVRFHHNGFSGQFSDYGEPLANMISKYNEMYGDDSYSQDSVKFAKSLTENGSRIRHHQYLPDLSSNW